MNRKDKHPWTPVCFFSSFPLKQFWQLSATYMLQGECGDPPESTLDYLTHCEWRWSVGMSVDSHISATVPHPQMGDDRYSPAEGPPHPSSLQVCWLCVSCLHTIYFSLTFGHLATGCCLWPPSENKCHGGRQLLTVISPGTSCSTTWHVVGDQLKVVDQTDVCWECHEMQWSSVRCERIIS